MRAFCTLSFAVKLALTALVLGFVIGLYLGSGTAPTDVGTPDAGALDISVEADTLPPLLGAMLPASVAQLVIFEPPFPVPTLRKFSALVVAFLVQASRCAIRGLRGGTEQARARSYDSVHRLFTPARRSLARLGPPVTRLLGCVPAVLEVPGLVTEPEDAQLFDAAGFDPTGFDTGRFDPQGFDSGGFDSGGFDPRRFETVEFDAADAMVSSRPARPAPRIR